MALVPRKQQQHYDPFKDLSDLGDRMFGLTLFPSVGRPSAEFEGGWLPAIDVSEEGDKIVVSADLPGLKREEIDVSFENGVLTLKGERRSESEKKDKNFHRVERSYGYFERQIPLAAEVDTNKIKATYNDGVLEITLPKSEQAKPKRIAVDVK